MEQSVRDRRRISQVRLGMAPIVDWSAASFRDSLIGLWKCAGRGACGSVEDIFKANLLLVDPCEYTAKVSDMGAALTANIWAVISQP